MTDQSSKKIECKICGEAHHLTRRHLETNHPDTSIEQYQKMYPDAPLVSEAGRKAIEKATLERKAPAGEKSMTGFKKAMHEVFDIPASTKGVMNGKGAPIPITVMNKPPEGYEDFVPQIDANYIFSVDLLKTVLMGLECNVNTYAVGHAGTGKSTLFEQVCARTKRAMLRVQHTVNTEESHVLGQYVVKGSDTVWEPGPLQICMLNGISYLADEYDRAMPQVLSVYQAVLEGKPLIAKEAPPEWRVVKPHANFRFLATGNTNGSGDETGLYPSTALQDFANYERFGLMVRVEWMPKMQEIGVVSGQGGILKEDATKLVEFATAVRMEFDKGKIGSPISPRALINTAVIGVRIADYSKALQLAFINRLNSVDREACNLLAQRHFG